MLLTGGHQKTREKIHVSIDQQIFGWFWSFIPRTFLAPRGKRHTQQWEDRPEFQLLLGRMAARGPSEPRRRAIVEPG